MGREKQTLDFNISTTLVFQPFRKSQPHRRVIFIEEKEVVLTEMHAGHFGVKCMIAKKSTYTSSGVGLSRRSVPI